MPKKVLAAQVLLVLRVEALYLLLLRLVLS
jgi:hypothetical protein